MNRYLLNIILGSILFVGCQNSQIVDSIYSEYEILKSEYSEVEIKTIIILEEHEPTFEELGNREFDRMIKLNDNLSKIIKSQFKIDSLIKVNIEQRNCFHKNAVKEWQLKYEAQNSQDSIRLKKEMKERVNNELQFYENELKMLEIEALIRSDSILDIKCKWIKHEINYILEGKNLRDTVVYIQYGDKKYSYLTENVFRKNE